MSDLVQRMEEEKDNNMRDKFVSFSLQFVESERVHFVTGCFDRKSLDRLGIFFCNRLQSSECS